MSENLLYNNKWVMIKKYITEHSFVKRGKRIYTISVGVLPPEQVEAYMKVVKERIMGWF